MNTFMSMSELETEIGLEETLVSDLKRIRDIGGSAVPSCDDALKLDVVRGNKQYGDPIRALLLAASEVETMVLEEIMDTMNYLKALNEDLSELMTRADERLAEDSKNF